MVFDFLFITLGNLKSSGLIYENALIIEEYYEEDQIKIMDY
jgi:hypothetical protein